MRKMPQGTNVFPSIIYPLDKTSEVVQERSSFDSRIEQQEDEETGLFRNQDSADSVDIFIAADNSK